MPSSSSEADPLSSGFGGILWNVPKRRRPLERRHQRKYGSAGKLWGNSHILHPNRRIRHDHQTGETFELSKLPLAVYRRVMDETKEIQARMSDTFGIGPRDQEVAVVYKGEESKDAKLRIVEMEKERPAFFSSALLQKSHRTPAVKSRGETTTTVRPTGLG